jgi:hypothetical protein
MEELEASTSQLLSIGLPRETADAIARSYMDYEGHETLIYVGRTVINRMLSAHMTSREIVKTLRLEPRSRLARLLVELIAGDENDHEDSRFWFCSLLSTLLRDRLNAGTESLLFPVDIENGRHFTFPYPLFPGRRIPGILIHAAENPGSGLQEFKYADSLCAMLKLDTYPIGSRSLWYHATVERHAASIISKKVSVFYKPRERDFGKTGFYVTRLVASHFFLVYLCKLQVAVRGPAMGI